MQKIKHSKDIENKKEVSIKMSRIIDRKEIEELILFLKVLKIEGKINFTNDELIKEFNLLKELETAVKSNLQLLEKEFEKRGSFTTENFSLNFIPYTRQVLNNEKLNIFLKSVNSSLESFKEEKEYTKKKIIEM